MIPFKSLHSIKAIVCFGALLSYNFIFKRHFKKLEKKEYLNCVLKKKKYTHLPLKRIAE